MSKKHYDSLSIPPGGRNFGGVEVLRAGIADQHLTLSIRRGFDEPTAWGELLATAGRQVARIFANELGLNEAETRARILAAFESEMNSTEDLGSIAPNR